MCVLVQLVVSVIQLKYYLYKFKDGCPLYSVAIFIWSLEELRRKRLKLTTYVFLDLPSKHLYSYPS